MCIKIYVDNNKINQKKLEIKLKKNNLTY